MGNPQDKNAQDFILDTRHDAPIADSVPPQRGCFVAATSAPQRRPEAARIVHRTDTLAQKQRDASCNRSVEPAQIL